MEKIKQQFRKISKKNFIDAGIIIIAILMGVFLGWDVVEILIFGIFIFTILNPIPTRYLAVPALAFLILSPIFLILERELLAERFAIYCYYFLVMAVIMAVYEIRKSEKK